ncbi:hypothetical protein KR038_007112, partial [Drosophila bunnanda]
ARLWLLGVLLLITIAASSWPTGTSAAPRVARGAHLIWPHPNSSTEPAPSTPKAPVAAAAAAGHPLRRRLKARRHHHVFVREAAKEPSVLIINQTEGLSNCKGMEVKANAVAELEKALQKAQSYKETVICLTEDWLQNFYNGTSISVESHLFKLLKLNLEHPLQDRVSQVTLSAEGKFEYKGPVGSLEEEMPKIIETLLVLETLINSVNYSKGHYPCTFRYIKDAVQSNTASAMVLMKEQQCNPQREIHYNKGLVRLPFFVAMETIKVLTVLEYTYEQLLSSRA